jgi:DNA-directed RNA polymerase subunit RPC12/RpoP
MIRFACPRCKSVHERPDSVAGTKFACPSCGQRLEVPLHPESKTVMGNPMGTEVPGAAVPPAPPPVPGADVQVRTVQGREHVFWYCPLCQSQVDVALDLGQSTTRCPHCSKRIAVPQPTAAAAPPFAVPPAGQPIPFAPPYVTSQNPGGTSPARRGGEAPEPPPVPEARSRRRDRDDDDDDDDDFPSIERRAPRRGRYSKEVSARAASSGLVCALISLGLLLVTFVLWVVAAGNARHRMGPDGEQPLFVVAFLVILGSFVLAILGIVFSSRGLDESNTYNRGQATAGLVCSIISLVIGSVLGLFLMCVGIFLMSAHPGRW